MEPKQHAQKSWGPDTKDGGQRGGPKRWKGSGPKPARHIPWPEIFKHHTSLIEGHLRMMDMVRKHTVEGTGNWRAVSDMIDRTKEMLHAAKATARTFVPPLNHRDQVPLGVSSVSMYPGYSPADHEYGKAAEEYGAFAAAARAQGVDVKHPNLEHELGQARGIKRKNSEEIRESTDVKHGGPGSRGAGEAPGGPEPKPMTPYALHLKNQAKGKKTTAETVTNGGNPYFVIDLDPAPVNLTGLPTQSFKRSASPEPLEQEKSKKANQKHKGNLPQTTDHRVESENISSPKRSASHEPPEQEKSKKAKKKHEGSLPQATDHRVESEDISSPKRSASHEPPEQEKSKKAKKKHEGNLPQGIDHRVEFEDISQEVDARLKEKEAKRKRKEEKKRKREPADFTTGPAASTGPAEFTGPAESSAAAEVGQQKKKSRKSEGNVLVERSTSKKRHNAEDGERQEDGKNKKRKKSKERVEV